MQNKGFLPELVCIGKITSPHGIRGELKVWPYTPFPERFLQVDRVYLKKGEDVRTYHVLNVRFTAHEIFIALKECPDRTAAQELSGYSICVPESERGLLPEGYYYHDDLVGMSVFDGDGTFIGEVKFIYERGMQDCLAVVTREKKEVLIPFHANFVLNVDASAGKITIKTIPGLVDE